MKSNNHALYALLVGVLTISAVALSQNGITYSGNGTDRFGSTHFRDRNGITYSGNHAERFGDYVFTYCECRWLAYVHNLELYYKPFQYGDQLIASISHKHVKDHTKKRELYIKSARKIKSKLKDVLYVTNDHFTADFQVDWADKEFLKLIRAEIALIDPSSTKKVTIPPDHYSVALHIRRGGGADRKLFQEDIVTSAEGWLNANWNENDFADKKWPKRFPPDAYYIEQLKALVLLHPGKEFYVHIFTDDPAPEKIAKKYEDALNNPRITFGYRTEDNKHNNNVLEDFFAMMHFDALIRAGSHYSAMAGVLGGVSYEVSPASYRWEGRKLIIHIR